MPFDPNYGNLGDDELLALARQAGVLPQEEAPPVEEQTRQNFHTWVPEQLGYNQNYTDPTQVPESSPTTPGVQNPSEVKNSQAVGVGMTHSGFSEGQFAKTGQTLHGLDADYAKINAQVGQRTQDYTRAAMMPVAGQINAAQSVARANVDKINAQGEQALVMQRLQDDFAAEETKAYAQAQAMSNQAKQDYLAALADFRASKVNPAQLWGKMTGGERFGTLVTAFVHDFLGAKGINTSAMATFNKAIDRNIDAQIQAIKTKGEVAEGFKSLWWMQRTQAASDAEARARIRGFLLEGTKQAIVSNMAQYESALASAQGQAAIAEIDKELSNTLIEIYKHADANAVALRNQALEKWKARLQASMEQQGLNLRAQELDLQRKKLDAETKTPSIEPIYDPETGRAQWYFQPWVQKEERIKTRETMEALHALNADFNDLRELQRQADSIADPLARSRLADTVHQKMDALATRMAHNFAKANGERATDQDVQDFLKGMRQMTWLNQGDADKLIAFTQETMIRPALSKLKTVAFDMPKELQDKYGTTASTPAFAGSLADAHNTSSPPPKTSQEIQRESALKGLAPEVKNQAVPDEELTPELQKAHEEAKRQYPMFFGKKETPFTGTVGPEMIRQLSESVSGSEVKEFERTMVHLRDLAASGDVQARGQLEAMAKPYLNPTGSGTSVSEDPESVFA